MFKEVQGLPAPVFSPKGPHCVGDALKFRLVSQRPIRTELSEKEPTDILPGWRAETSHEVQKD